jgi:hypothetical protein
VQCSQTVAVVAFAREGACTSRPLVICGTVGLDTVDVLARLHLRARRLGLAMTVHDPVPDLELLIGLAGLTAVLGGAVQSM